MKVDWMRRRERWLAGGCALLLLGAFAGCANGSTTDGGANADQSAASHASLGDDGGPTDPAGAPVKSGVTGDADRSPTEPNGAPEPAELAASVNGQPVALADFQSQALETQRYFVDKGLDPNTDAGQRQLLALRRQVLSEMINQALIEQEAARKGITATNQEVEASLAGYREQSGGTADFDAARNEAGASDADVFAMERQAIVGRKFVEDISRDLPTAAPFYHARHVLCATEAECTAALARLDGGEDFAAVAAAVSKDEVSAAQGGDLGWVPIIKGFTYLPSADLQTVIAGLQAGQRSAVVKTDYGYHVVEVTEVDPAREIDADLGFKLREKRVQDWLAEQHRSADIIIYITDLKDALEIEG